MQGEAPPPARWTATTDHMSAAMMRTSPGCASYTPAQYGTTLRHRCYGAAPDEHPPGAQGAKVAGGGDMGGVRGATPYGKRSAVPVDGTRKNAPGEWRGRGR